MAVRVGGDRAHGGLAVRVEKGYPARHDTPGLGTSRLPREVSRVSANSIFWRKGVVHRKRAGRRIRSRYCRETLGSESYSTARGWGGEYDKNSY